ncbi:MAG: ion transporter [Pseudomonadota bacterium]|nr:ion transporter [Pseudomonadota bacterium]
MKQILLDEIAQIDEQIITCEAEFDELAEKSHTVKLEKRHGSYELTLDKVESQILRLNTQKEDLLEKLDAVEEVLQKKYLKAAQVKIFGSSKLLMAKDIIVFFLILFVITVLVVDIFGIGAPGAGAVVKAEVVDGKLVGVKIENSGVDYGNVNILVEDRVGNGALLYGKIIEGRLSSVEIIDEGQNYANPLLEIRPYFSNKLLWTFWIIDFICCVIFLFNFFFELRLSKSKKWYWKRNWIDFITSIPLPPVQILAASSDMGVIRMGRLLRAIRFIRGLRALRVLLFLWRGMDHLGTSLNVKLLKRSLLYAVMSILIGACFFMSLERMESGAGFLPSLWWSFTTLVTGGYADIHDPQTGLGKILTVFLVITGMVLVGVFTATLTSVMVKNDDASQTIQELEDQTDLINGMKDNITNVDNRLDKLESAIDKINASIKPNDSNKN